MTTDSGADKASSSDGIPHAMAHEGDNSNVPKPKRLACMICRKRKLKCDGIKPSCSTCTRLSHSCAYDEVRRKSGPKRGYVKALEERLSALSPLPRSSPVHLLYGARELPLRAAPSLRAWALTCASPR